MPALIITYRIREEKGPSVYCSPAPGLDFPTSHYVDYTSYPGHNLTLAFQIPSYAAIYIYIGNAH